MNNYTRKKLDLIDSIANADAKYSRMLRKCGTLEKKFDEVVKKLSNEDQDVAWDFVMHCETMSRHVLELACTYMEFPQKQTK